MVFKGLSLTNKALMSRTGDSVVNNSWLSPGSKNGEPGLSMMTVHSASAENTLNGAACPLS